MTSKVGENLRVVEEDATWPLNRPPTQVAAVFRVGEGKVTVVLRLPDRGSALDRARVHHALAATV